MHRSSLALLTAFLVFFFAFLIPPSLARADSQVWPTGFWGPILSCTGNYHNTPAVGPEGVQKKCTDLCDLLYTGRNAVDFATTLVIFIGAPAMITFGGIMLLIPGDSGENRKMAKDIIVSALIGVGITLGAYIMISTFLWLFGNNETSRVRVSWPDIVCEVK